MKRLINIFAQLQRRVFQLEKSCRELEKRLSNKFETVAGRYRDGSSKLDTAIELMNKNAARIESDIGKVSMKTKKSIQANEKKEFEKRLHGYEQVFSSLLFLPVLARCTVAFLAFTSEESSEISTAGRIIFKLIAMMFSLPPRNSRTLPLSAIHK